MMSRVLASASIGAMALLLSGCGENAAEATDTPAFEACIDDAGLSLAGNREWGQAEWNQFFTEPEALTCAVDELDDSDRRTALTESFPPYWKGDVDFDDDPLGARFEALAAYTATATAAAGEDAALLGGRALVTSLDWESVDAVELAVLHLVTAMLEEQGELVDYEPSPPAEDLAEASPTDRRSSIGRDLRGTSGPLADRFRDLYDGVLESFDASTLVP